MMGQSDTCVKTPKKVTAYFDIHCVVPYGHHFGFVPEYGLAVA